MTNPCQIIMSAATATASTLSSAVSNTVGCIFGRKVSVADAGQSELGKTEPVRPRAASTGFNSKDSGITSIVSVTLALGLGFGVGVYWSALNSLSAQPASAREHILTQGRLDALLASTATIVVGAVVGVGALLYSCVMDGRHSKLD